MDDLLFAVPNVSEGRDPATLKAVRAGFERTGAARVLDVHADPDHHRAVFTIVARAGELAPAVLEGAKEAVARIDVTAHPGLHPHVGAVDVAPVVFLDEHLKGQAVAEALVLADEIGVRLDVPVLLYGHLANGRTRAELRRGGPAELARRLRGSELRTDFGPPHPHPTAGSTLVAARPPLIAFNVELKPPATLQTAKDIAAKLRESGSEGLPHVRAIGLQLANRDDVAQVSFNVEDHRATPLADLIRAVRKHADVAEVEVVGLPPRAAFEGFPDDVEVRNRRTLEEALADAENMARRPPGHA